jgi:hypothetical protein
MLHINMCRYCVRRFDFGPKEYGQLLSCLGITWTTTQAFIIPFLRQSGKPEPTVLVCGAALLTCGRLTLAFAFTGARPYPILRPPHLAYQQNAAVYCQPVGGPIAVESWDSLPDDTRVDNASADVTLRRAACCQR